MTLEALDNQILATRQQAVDARAHYTDTRDKVQADTMLSTEGKSAYIAEARQLTNQAMADFQAREMDLITRERERVEGKLAGSIGTSPDAVIAYRDAQDRADAINDRQTAQRVIQRALHSRDESLASAVAQRALSEGWTEASDLYTAAHPELTSLLADRAKLDSYVNDINRIFQRGAIYSTVQ